MKTYNSSLTESPNKSISLELLFFIGRPASSLVSNHFAIICIVTYYLVASMHIVA